MEAARGRPASPQAAPSRGFLTAVRSREGSPTPPPRRQLPADPPQHDGAPEPPCHRNDPSTKKQGEEAYELDFHAPNNEAISCRYFNNEATHSIAHGFREKLNWLFDSDKTTPDRQ